MEIKAPSEPRRTLFSTNIESFYGPSLILLFSLLTSIQPLVPARLRRGFEFTSTDQQSCITGISPNKINAQPIIQQVPLRIRVILDDEF